MGKGKKRMAASLGMAQKQAQLQALPLIKTPIELIGKTIKVPGSYWEGRMTADESLACLSQLQGNEKIEKEVISHTIRCLSCRFQDFVKKCSPVFPHWATVGNTNLGLSTSTLYRTTMDRALHMMYNALHMVWYS